MLESQSISIPSPFSNTVEGQSVHTYILSRRRSTSGGKAARRHGRTVGIPVLFFWFFLHHGDNGRLPPLLPGHEVRDPKAKVLVLPVIFNPRTFAKPEEMAVKPTPPRSCRHAFA